MAQSILDDFNRNMNRFSDKIMENPTIARMAIAMSPALATQQANRRAAIESRYPAPQMAVNDMEARWSGITAPRRVESRPQQTAIGQPRALQSIAAPIPSNLAPIRAMRGGFVGAATDAQAEKAMQDRAAQSAAAQQNIASMTSEANALRDLRATRLGISRGVLDRMEGRGEEIAQGDAPGSIGDPFSMPGDSFQDTRGRKAAFDRAVGQAMDGNRGERQGAQIAMQGLAGFAGQNRVGDEIMSRERTALDEQEAGILKGSLAAKSDANKQWFEQAKWGQQFGLDAAKFDLDANKAALDAKRQSVLDQATLDKNAKESPNDIKAELLRRYLAGGKDAQEAYAALQKLFPSNDLSSLLGTQ